MKMFYGGEIICILGNFSNFDNLDFILDLIDEYIELRESVLLAREREVRKR